MRPYLHLLNPAGVLCAIRDGKAKNMQELEVFFGIIEPTEADFAAAELQYTERERQEWYSNTSRNFALRADLYDYLDRLTQAGFIEINGKNILPTPIIEKFQAALQFSLSEHAAMTPYTLRVNPIFGPPSTPVSRFDIFVVMPFSSQLAPIYKNHILKAANSLGFTAARADDSVRPEAIVKTIWDWICSARLIIADCTGANPNVLYEIGIAHTVGKPVILLTQSAEDIPYDLAQLRSLVYGTTPRELESLEKRLRDAILET